MSSSLKPINILKGSFLLLPWTLAEICLLGLMVTCLIFVIIGFRESESPMKISKPVKPREVHSVTEEIPLQNGIDESFIENLLNKHRQRALFKNFEKPLPMPMEPKISAPKGPTLAQKIKEVSLLGIVDGDPIQAIIEDLRTKDVYYVRQGDIAGEFEILSISRNGVELKYQDETATLQ